MQPLAKCQFDPPLVLISQMCYDRFICYCQDPSTSDSDSDWGPSNVNEDIDTIWYSEGEPLLRHPTNLTFPANFTLPGDLTLLGA